MPSLTFTFNRPETGQKESVVLERWVWEVTYTDGSKLSQFDTETLVFHQLKEIDQSKEFIFRMWNTAEEKPPITLVFNPQIMKLIHFYRRGILDNLSTHVTLYVFGYQIDGISHFHVLMPDDELLITNDISSVGFESQEA